MRIASFEDFCNLYFDLGEKIDIHFFGKSAIRGTRAVYEVRFSRKCMGMIKGIVGNIYFTFFENVRSRKGLKIQIVYLKR